MTAKPFTEEQTAVPGRNPDPRQGSRRNSGKSLSNDRPAVGGKRLPVKGRVGMDQAVMPGCTGRACPNPFPRQICRLCIRAFRGNMS